MFSLRLLLCTSHLLLSSCLSLASSVPYTSRGSPGPQTIHYELNFTWGSVSHDGHVRNGTLINGTSPGPTLELREGDSVEILVHNNQPFEDSIHWHGIEQLGTPWSDGVPGLSQNAIQPGQSFLYRFMATPYGTYWYHSHHRSHIMDGSYGPIVIHPKLDEPTPFHTISNDSAQVYRMQQAEYNPKLVMISDWSHFSSEEFFAIEQTVGIDNPCLDSVLINGKGSEYCLPRSKINSLTDPMFTSMNVTLTDKGCIPAEVANASGNFTHDFSKLPATAFDVCEASFGGHEVINVDPADEWVSINFINAAGIDVITASIDEHEMVIYAVDGRHIIPVPADAVSIQVGNRYSAMVKLDQKPGDYIIRFPNSGDNQLISGFATLSYRGNHPKFESVPFINYAGHNTSADVVFFDETTIQPFPPSQPAAHADRTVHLSIARTGEAWEWELSGHEPFNVSLEEVTPLLFNPDSFGPANRNLTIVTKMGEWVDLIVEAPPPNPPHPLHKHSNKGYVIGQGTGAFNWTTVAEAMKVIPQSFNLKNPPLRDGYTTLAASTKPSWIVIRYHVENPGVYLFHCHIQPHLIGGMAVAIIDGIDNLPTIPPEYLHGNGIAADNRRS